MDEKAGEGVTWIEGLFHVHSTYSADGRSSVDEIASFCRKRGFRFVFLVEHSIDLTEETMRSFVTECSSLSSVDLTLVPGIEFEFEGRRGLHLLGLGVERCGSFADPSQAAGFVHGQGGLAVLAHPSRIGNLVPEEILAGLDGIEVWNGTYDSRYLPDPGSLGLYRRAKMLNGSVKAYAGLDMHSVSGFKEITLHVAARSAGRDDLLKGLKEGKFRSRGPLYRLAAEPGCGAISLSALGAGRLIIESADRLRRLAVKRTA